MPTNKQRREAARRKLERQLEARDERSRRRRQGNLIASVIGGIVVVAVVIGIVVLTNGHKSKQTAASTPAATSVAATSAASSAAATSAAPTAAAHPYPCTFTTSGTSAVAGIKKPTSTSPAKTGSVTIAVKSNLGNLTFTLNRAGAPCAVESFVSLVQQKYFNNSPCHRLVTSGIYVLQCGDPTGKGTGGPGYTVNDEYTGKETYPVGEIAMANTGAADSTGSQFFIMTKDSTSGLGKTYTVIGTVSAGMPIIQKVAAAGETDTSSSSPGDGAPKLPIKFTSMTVAK